MAKRTRKATKSKRKNGSVPSVPAKPVGVSKVEQAPDVPSDPWPPMLEIEFKGLYPVVRVWTPTRGVIHEQHLVNLLAQATAKLHGSAGDLCHILENTIRSWRDMHERARRGI